MHSCDSQTALRQNPARVPASLLPGLPGIVVALCLVLAGCNDTPHKAETDESSAVAAVQTGAAERAFAGGNARG